MSFYKDHVYPHLVSKLGIPKPIEEFGSASSRWSRDGDDSTNA